MSGAGGRDPTADPGDRRLTPGSYATAVSRSCRDVVGPLPDSCDPEVARPGGTLGTGRTVAGPRWPEADRLASRVHRFCLLADTPPLLNRKISGFPTNSSRSLHKNWDLPAGIPQRKDRIKIRRQNGPEQPPCRSCDARRSSARTRRLDPIPRSPPTPGSSNRITPTVCRCAGRAIAIALPRNTLVTRLPGPGCPRKAPSPRCRQ